MTVDEISSPHFFVLRCISVFKPEFIILLCKTKFGMNKQFVVLAYSF